MIFKNNFVDYQNKYVRRSSIINNVTKNVNIRAISLRVLHNYFDDLTKLFRFVSS